MADLLSPGVVVNEFDLTTIVPSVSSSVGAFSGLFKWGPVMQRTLIDDENTLVSLFGKPTDFNAETWFTAANFLAYSGALQLVRAANTSPGTGLMEKRLLKHISFVSNSAVSNDIYVVVNPANTNQINATASNTSNLAVGMYINQTQMGSPFGNNFQGNASYGYISQVINSTAIRLSGLSQNNSSTLKTAAQYFWFADANVTTSAVGMHPAIVYSSNIYLNTVKSDIDYENKGFNYEINCHWVARYPGALGNSLKVSTVDSPGAFRSIIPLVWTGKVGAVTRQFNGTYVIGANANAANIYIKGDGTAGGNGYWSANVGSRIALGDEILIGNNVVGIRKSKVTLAHNFGAVNATHSRVALRWKDRASWLKGAWTTNTINRWWEYSSMFKTAPGYSQYMVDNRPSPVVDEVHMVVVDEEGQFTGVPGTVLETYKGLSRASDAKTGDGTSLYIRDVISQSSKYVRMAMLPEGYGANTITLRAPTDFYTEPMPYSLRGGFDGKDESNVPLGTIVSGYELFNNRDIVNIDILLQGRPISGTYTDVDTGIVANNFDLAIWLVDNFSGGGSFIVPDGSTTPRNDCVICISPDKDSVLSQEEFETEKLITWRDRIGDSSYTVMDTGYKYQYDRYNDKHRWIPLNGDVGGIIARTDLTHDAWWSPGGFNRGQIKNVTKLMYNPARAARDELYSAGINPIVAFHGSGTIMFGDKTLQYKSSAFDRINVRRLFITIEKAIAEAAKYTLFEFNDVFTRSQFKAMVIPYLTSIQARRGIQDFIVVCDETNNTGQVIDSGKFIGDIYVKPARAINYIHLNFIAVGTDVAFSTVIQQF